MTYNWITDILPQTRLARIGWAFQFSYLVIGIGIFVHFIYNDLRERGGNTRLPDADALRNRGAETLADYQHRPILYYILRTLYFRGGYIQEEEITATLEQKILSRAESLRDFAALAILTALLFTFFTLHLELRESAVPGMAARLPAVLDLVGVNWPGILAALICTSFAGIARYRNTDLLKCYRNWLDADIFPRLSAARTTVDQLGTLTRELKDTVEKLSLGLQPLASLPAVLSHFQSDVIGSLIPNLVDGLQRVPVSLSDATVQQLRKISGDSNKLIAQLTRDYGRLVLLSEQSERRQTEIAAGIASATAAIREIKGPCETLVAALTDCANATTLGSMELRNCTAELKTVGNEIPRLTFTSEQLGNRVNELGRPLDDATRAVNSVRDGLAGIAANVEKFPTKLNEVAALAAELGDAVSRVPVEVRDASAKVEASAAALIASVASVEHVVAGGITDLQSIAQSAIGEATTLRNSLSAAHQTVSTAQASLIDSANKLFDQAAHIREAEREALVEAGAVLQNSTKSLEDNIEEAARVLADSLGQTSGISTKQRELESKIRGVDSNLSKLDRETRGRRLLRRVFRVGNSQ